MIKENKQTGIISAIITKRRTSRMKRAANRIESMTIDEIANLKDSRAIQLQGDMHGLPKTTIKKIIKNDRKNHKKEGEK